MPTTDNIAPQQSDQIALGITSQIKSFEVSVEGWHKWMDNLLEYRDGVGFLDINDDWEQKVAIGKGTSYGVELFIQKKLGKSTGWIGYTWSKSNRDFEELNFGNQFPYRYDRRHDVSLVYNLSINQKTDLGAVWVYGTGNSLTLPSSEFPKATWNTNGVNYDGFVKSYPGRNSSRTEAYHRLDLSISFKKQVRLGERKWVLGLFNSYSRLNPTFIEFDDDDPLNKAFEKLSLFPVIPSVSYQLKF